MTTTGLILLQTGGGSSNYPFMITMIGVMLVFYFFMVLPQQKKQKNQKKFLENLAKGDDVVTIGGLHGKIQSVEDKTVTLMVDKSVKLTFDKASISMEASQRIQNS
ncbi:MAG: preprotein translocase subunit YajC [Microscillaceae bacterium]|nr:preprotein translocase subunit YajC [Microscillaceae bacterium]